MNDEWKVYKQVKEAKEKIENYSAAAKFDVNFWGIPRHEENSTSKPSHSRKLNSQIHSLLEKRKSGEQGDREAKKRRVGDAGGAMEPRGRLQEKEIQENMDSETGDDPDMDWILEIGD